MVSNVHISVGKYDWIHASYSQGDKGAAEFSHSKKVLVVLIHGFPNRDLHSHNNLFALLQDKLAKENLDSLSFDFRGCGKSDGKAVDFNFQTAREDLRAIYSWAKESGYHSLVIIAEGFGASAAIIELPSECKALVLLWPMLDPNHTYLHEHINRCKDPNVKQKGYIEIEKQKIGLTFLKQLETCDLTQYIDAINIPILIHHGLLDDVIPIEQLALIREHVINSKRIEITTYDTGAHGLLAPNERETMFYHIKQFLLKYINQ